MFKRLGLKTVAFITAVILLTIIGLQVYWLQNSYTEQKLRLQSDLENAVMATLIKYQLSGSLRKLGISDTSSDAAIETALAVAMTVNKPAQPAKGRKTPVVNIHYSGTNKQAEEALLKLVSSDIKDKNGVIHPVSLSLLDIGIIIAPDAYRFNAIKSVLGEELRNRGINTRFELALLDTMGNLSMATCDTSYFKNIKFKSGINGLSMSSKEAKIQAAIPHASRYLLGNMVWILALTTTLIIIVSISFGYLLIMFFKQKRMADIRNDFLNNMTHELKTPISSVAIALEMMQDERHKLSDEKKRDYARIAQGELKRLTLLVEKVLKMAAFDKGEIQIKREQFLAAGWLHDILASMRPVFETAGAQVNISVNPEGLQLYADKTHITNILTNLVENALKYNDKPEPVINITLGEEGNDTVLSVTDNGRGIPAAYVSKVLDKFFRVPAGDLHDIKGYGLGLSYVKAAVELHGGTIAVKSALGHGSTFTIHLPKNTTNA